MLFCWQATAAENARLAKIKAKEVEKRDRLEKAKAKAAAKQASKTAGAAAADTAALEDADGASKKKRRTGHHLTELTDEDPPVLRNKFEDTQPTIAENLESCLHDALMILMMLHNSEAAFSALITCNLQLQCNVSGFLDSVVRMILWNPLWPAILWSHA